MANDFSDLASTRERSRLLELIKLTGYYTGFLWLTPFVGTIDDADLQHLRGSILRDLSWIASMAASQGAESLDRSAARLTAVVNNLKRPWHALHGWTDYGAIRLELLASLPEDAHAAALAELRNMEALILPGNREKWNALADKIKKEIESTSAHARKRVPHELQELWREVDFGRARRARANAKHTTVARLTWSLVATITVVTTVTLSRYERGEIRPWLVTLFGLLGGSVSSLRSVNMGALPERRSLEIEAITLRLRPVVGAMAALMLYVIGRSGILFQVVGDDPVPGDRTTPIQLHVGAEGIRWTYYTLAFLAGFSERLFLGMLDAIERTAAGKAAAQAAPPTGSDTLSTRVRALEERLHGASTGDRSGSEEETKTEAKAPASEH